MVAMKVAWTVAWTVGQMVANWADLMVAKKVACLVGYLAAGSAVKMVDWWEWPMVVWLAEQKELPKVDSLAVSLAAEKAEPMDKMMVVVWVDETVSKKVESLGKKWADESEQLMVDQSVAMSE